MCLNPRLDARFFAIPAGNPRGFQMPLSRQMCGNIQRNPAGDFRVGIVLQVVQFPDAGILLFPDIGAGIRQRGEQSGGGEIQYMSGADKQQGGSQQIAIHTELLLVAGVIAYTHRV